MILSTIREYFFQRNYLVHSEFQIRAYDEPEMYYRCDTNTRMEGGAQTYTLPGACEQNGA